VLASGNPGKLQELRDQLPSVYQVMGPAQAGIPADLPEDGVTLRENALQKAREAHRLCGLACLADDSGLEVDALGGAPGVYSARFAGSAKDPVANMRVLLDQLGDRSDRSARFRTVLALVDADAEHCFEGVVEGSIASAPRGTGGFGYDPIFVPEGEARTFAEMEPAAKHAISHRGRAMRALLAHLDGSGQR
jgi:XTP/dITP diphosphohydrolase